MNNIELYQQVADAYHAQGKYQERDRFLVLALDAAHSSNQGNLAEQLRQRLLELNPNHLIKPYASCTAAIQAPNFMTYLTQLRKNFPPAKAQSLLQDLGGAKPIRPKRTMLAEPSFPAAEPIEERHSPGWSQFNVETKPRAKDGPSIGIYHLPPEPAPLPVALPPVNPMNDPLANVPMSSQTPFNLEPAVRRAPQQASTRQPEIIPAPSSRSRNETISPSGVWLGNLLFVVLFLASLATLAYIFVLPFYPDVARMLKSGN